VREFYQAQKHQKCLSPQSPNHNETLPQQIECLTQKLTSLNTAVANLLQSKESNESTILHLTSNLTKVTAELDVLFATRHQETLTIKNLSTKIDSQKNDISTLERQKIYSDREKIALTKECDNLRVNYDIL
jgi:chromosome segregation ATPase